MFTPGFCRLAIKSIVCLPKMILPLDLERLAPGPHHPPAAPSGDCAVPESLSYAERVAWEIPTNAQMRDADASSAAS